MGRGSRQARPVVCFSCYLRALAWIFLIGRERSAFKSQLFNLDSWQEPFQAFGFG